MKISKKNLFTSKVKHPLTEGLRRVVATFIICQMLITQSIFAGDISEDENLLEQQESCVGDSVEWNTTLNSCSTIAEAEEAKASSEDCANSSDPDMCYLSSAESISGVSAGDNIDESNIENIERMIAVAYALFSIINYAVKAIGAKNKIKQKAITCKSSRLFQITSFAWLAGDFYLKWSGEEKFEEIAENYEKEVANDELLATEEGSYQAQVRAFEYLKQEQESVQSQANKRKILQIAAIAGYTAVVGFGAAELMGIMPRCKSGGSDSEAAESSTTDSTAESETKMQADKAEVTSIAEGLFGKIKKLIGSSLGNIISGAILLGINAYLIYHANQEKKKAEDNIESIDEVLSSYSAYMSGFCPDGRDDVSDTSCYCYNSDGSQNSDRTNSNICQNLFAATNVDYAAQTEVETTSSSRQGCITVTGEFDINCKCANMTNTTTGQNACATVSSLSTTATGFTSALDIPTAITTANALTNGASSALATLDSASLTSGAAKNKKLANSILNSAKKNKIDIPNANQIDKMISKELKKGASSLPSRLSANSMGISHAQNTPASVASALEKAKTSNVSAAAGALISSLSKGKGSIGSKSAKSNSFVWNDSSSGSGGKVQTFMDKEYKYKNSDIVNRKDVSLWNVISKRYQTSGVKRLFSDEDDE